jgi:hypothetical protein
LDFIATQFLDRAIEARFDTSSICQKSPLCPDGFSWEERTYHVAEKLAEWTDFSRRGRMARTLCPTYAEVAAERGPLGAGRFYFRVRTNTEEVFDLYYDRQIKSVDNRLGPWFLYYELSEE